MPRNRSRSATSTAFLLLATGATGCMISGALRDARDQCLRGVRQQCFAVARQYDGPRWCGTSSCQITVDEAEAVAQVRDALAELCDQWNGDVEACTTVFETGQPARGPVAQKEWTLRNERGPMRVAKDVATLAGRPRPGAAEPRRIGQLRGGQRVKVQAVTRNGWAVLSISGVGDLAGWTVRDDKWAWVEASALVSEDEFGRFRDASARLDTIERDIKAFVETPTTPVEVATKIRSDLSTVPDSVPALAERKASLSSWLDGAEKERRASVEHAATAWATDAGRQLDIVQAKLASAPDDALAAWEKMAPPPANADREVVDRVFSRADALEPGVVAAAIGSARLQIKRERLADYVRAHNRLDAIVKRSRNGSAYERDVGELAVAGTRLLVKAALKTPLPRGDDLEALDLAYELVDTAEATAAAAGMGDQVARLRRKRAEIERAEGPPLGKGLIGTFVDTTGAALYFRADGVHRVTGEPVIAVYMKARAFKLRITSDGFYELSPLMMLYRLEKVVGRDDGLYYEEPTWVADARYGKCTDPSCTAIQFLFAGRPAGALDSEVVRVSKWGDLDLDASARVVRLKVKELVAANGTSVMGFGDGLYVPLDIAKRALVAKLHEVEAARSKR